MNVLPYYHYIICIADTYIYQFKLKNLGEKQNKIKIYAAEFNTDSEEIPEARVTKFGKKLLNDMYVNKFLFLFLL